jgi:hypothetical protein
MKKIITVRKDDIVSLVELNTNRIYGVIMNYIGHGGSQVDVLTIQHDSNGYYFENSVCGHKYPTRYKTLQKIVQSCLGNKVYTIYEFEDTLEYYKWAVNQMETLLTTHNINSGDISGFNEDYELEDAYDTN